MSHMTNPLASAAQLERCRARTAALPLPADLVDAVFFGVQCLTQAAGMLLELPQSETARANVVLARYWLVAPGFLEPDGRSARIDGLGSELRAAGGGADFDYSHVSAAALYMVAKTGASPRSARDVASAYAYLAAARFWGRSPRAATAADGTYLAGAYDDAYLADGAYAAFHARVLALEARILVALGFDAHVALPHPLAVTYLQALDFLGTAAPPPDPTDAAPDSTRARLTRTAVAYLNTALLSPQLLYLTHQPHELAVAAIYNAARDTACHMPADAPWWEVFDVDRETLGFLAVALRSVASWATALQQRQASADTPAAARLLEGGILTRQRLAEAAATWDQPPPTEQPANACKGEAERA